MKPDYLELEGETARLLGDGAFSVQACLPLGTADVSWGFASDRQGYRRSGSARYDPIDERVHVELDLPSATIGVTVPPVASAQLKARPFLGKEGSQEPVGHLGFPYFVSDERGRFELFVEDQRGVHFSVWELSSMFRGWGLVTGASDEFLEMPGRWVRVGIFLGGGIRPVSLGVQSRNIGDWVPPVALLGDYYNTDFVEVWVPDAAIEIVLYEGEEPRRYPLEGSEDSIVIR